MFDVASGFVTNNSTMLMGGGVTGLVLWVLKKVPNEQIANIVSTACYGVGKIMTGGLSHWKWTKGMWNKTIEPYFIDLVENTAGAAVNGFIKGLRSDK